jgi:GNAT superfamily N-acetyltransferase
MGGQSGGGTPIGSNMSSFYNGGTIAGSYLTGKAAFAQGLGQYNYNTALAIRQLEEADRQAIDNHNYAVKSYYDLRRMNEEYWLSLHPRSTPEQIAQINVARVPRRLTTSELDPTWGQIRWPAVLEHPEFDADRLQLDDVFAHRNEEGSGVGSAVYAKVLRLTRDMRSILDQEYATMSQMEWIYAMRFLESLAYEARFAPGVVVGLNSR